MDKKGARMAAETFLRENLTDLCFELHKRTCDDIYNDGGAIDQLASLIAIYGAPDGMPPSVEAVRMIRNAAVARLAAGREVADKHLLLDVLQGSARALPFEPVRRRDTGFDVLMSAFPPFRMLFV